MSRQAKKLRSLVITIIAVGATNAAIAYGLNSEPAIPSETRIEKSGLPMIPDPPRPRSGVPMVPDVPRP